MDSASLIIYPEIKATEVTFSALKRYLCSFYFRIDNETGGIHRNTLYVCMYLARGVAVALPAVAAAAATAISLRLSSFSLLLSDLTTDWKRKEIHRCFKGILCWS